MTFFHYGAQAVGTVFIVWLVVRAWRSQWDKGRSTTRTAVLFTIAGACLIGGMFSRTRTWSIGLWASGVALVIWIWVEALMAKRLVGQHLKGHPHKVGKFTKWLFKDYFDRDHGV